MEKCYVGIDLGGSHVSIGLVNQEGKILELFEKDFTTKEKTDIANIAVRFIIETINNIKTKFPISKIGLGVAGTVSQGIIVKSVNLGIKNFNIKKEIELKTNLQVTVKNDAKCAAIAEYHFGAFGDGGKMHQNVLFLTLGTGIGGSYIYKGQLMEGTIFDGFEFGHMIIKENGVLCRCGKRGCFEKYGSILTFKRKVMDRLNLSYDISGKDLREIINNQKEKINDIIEEYVCDLSIGISNLINIFEPDCVIIGGGYARYDYLFQEQLKNQIINSNLLFNTRDEIIIKAANLGNDAGIIGAAMLNYQENLN